MSTRDDRVILRCAPAGWAASEIQIGLDVLGECVAALAEAPGQSFLLVDDGIPLSDHGRLAELIDAHPRNQVLRIEGGESCKKMAMLERVLDALATANIDRSGRLVAIGGGAVGDLGGLSASLWLRGIELWQVPTTLLSMVDSSVGGKTAIDLAAGKNLVGSFWQATKVFVDPGFLSSLESGELHSGLGEVLKIAIGLDAQLFEHCEHRLGDMKSGDIDSLTTAIDHCLRRKIEVVESDPTEKGRRRLLNLGHSLAHAIEAESGFTVRHGQAVALGLEHVTALSASIERLDTRARDRILACLGELAAKASQMTQARAAHWIRHDKKCVDGRLNAVLPIGIGESEVVSMSVDSFLAPMNSTTDC